MIEGHALERAAALGALLMAGSIDQDAAHCLGGRCEEMFAAIPGPVLFPSHEPEVGLINQGGRLERLARLLLGQLSGSQLPQLVIDQRQQVLRGGRIACLTAGEDTGDFGHRTTLVEQKHVRNFKYTLAHVAELGRKP